jgi:putative membrane protein
MEPAMTDQISARQVSPGLIDDPRVYFAAERTFLAWIRTGLAMMGFGFVVARFGLFLREVQAAQPGLAVKSYGLSVWFGTALIVIGVLVNLISAWRHVSIVRELRRGGASFTRPSTPAITVAVILAVVGLAMAAYLISVRGL